MAPKIFLNKIALVGANGNVGSHILSAPKAKDRFQITAISHVQSKATFSSDISVVHVNYAEPETLVNALKGQEALIITMSVLAHDAQEKLIRAAAQAGIGMTSGFWYEYSVSGGQYGIDLNKREVVYFDEGNQHLNTTTWPQTGLAVANLLSLPLSSSDEKGPTLDQYRNRMLFFSSLTLNQREVFEAVQKATGTKEKDWKISSKPVKERLIKVRQRLMSEHHSSFATDFYTRYFIDDAGLYEKNYGLNNDELSLPKEDLVEATKRAVELAKTDLWDKMFK